MRTPCLDQNEREADHEALEEQLRKSHQRRAKVRTLASCSCCWAAPHQRRGSHGENVCCHLQELKSALSAACKLEDDALLSALKRSPITAPLAAARARELVGDLLAADYRTQACPLPIVQSPHPTSYPHRPCCAMPPPIPCACMPEGDAPCCTRANLT